MNYLCATEFIPLPIVLFKGSDMCHSFYFRRQNEKVIREYLISKKLQHLRISVIVKRYFCAYIQK